jgi:hypothetical protein
MFQDMQLPALRLSHDLRTLEDAVDQASADGSALIFYGDYPVEPATDTNQFSINNFNLLMDYVARKRNAAQVVTAAEYIRRVWPDITPESVNSVYVADKAY